MEEQEDVISDFVVNDLLPQEIIPVSYVLTGSRGYGLDIPASDFDFRGIHLVDTHDLLEHPSFRPSFQIVERTGYLEPQGEIGLCGIVSYDMWRFLDIIKKGGFTAFEILYMPEIHHAEGADLLISRCRDMLTAKLGLAAQGIIRKDWVRHRDNRKKTVMALYRAYQALHYLERGEFEWRADALFDGKSGYDLYRNYLKSEMRDIPLGLEEIETVAPIFRNLIEDIDKAIISTKLPMHIPEKAQKDFLKDLKRIRLSLI